MRRTLLGPPGLDAPMFVIGTAAMEQIAVDESMRIFQRGYELGATWWDTSDDYGTHPLVASALPRYPRGELTISTKTSAKSYDEGVVAIREALFELGTEYLDILFLHFVRSEDDFNERQGCLRAMVEAKAAGKVRAIGLSSHYAAPIRLAAFQPDIDVVMAPWNVRGIMPNGGSPIETERAIQSCYRTGKGVVLMKVLANGMLRPAFDEAIRGAAHFQQKHAVIIGIRSVHELEVDIRLLLGQPVDASIVKRLKEGTEWGRAA